MGGVTQGRWLVTRLRVSVRYANSMNPNEQIWNLGNLEAKLRQSPKPDCLQNKIAKQKLILSVVVSPQSLFAEQPELTKPFLRHVQILPFLLNADHLRGSAVQPGSQHSSRSTEHV